MTQLSIVIVNYASGRLAKACVESIHRSAPHMSYEVIMVDNASPDDSQELLATEVPGIRFLPQTENVGFARGVNIGIAAAQGESILILNPDIIVLQGAIDRLMDFARAHPRAAMLAGQLVNPNGSVQDSCSRFYTPLTILARRTPVGMLPFARRHLQRILMRGEDRTRARPVDWVLGACMLVPRTALTKVGVMDERFFLYFEDMDWCRRFWEAGYEVWYVPDARFAHHHKRASAQESGLSALFQPITRIHIASGIKYFWKYRWEGVTPARRAN
ncbi:MAG: glycosyl transferase family protein [Parcubacteria group bacterium Gr01-1014_106]|nr:MAG: glycosyl transferase family protein [Parcubacteria group bacterium Gr01-1014_106]